MKTILSHSNCSTFPFTFTFTSTVKIISTNFTPIKNYPFYPSQKPTLINYPIKTNPIRITSSMSSSSKETETDTKTETYSVLFVCLGNICRSPAAEAVFKDLVTKKGFDSKFSIDSAGTIGYHEGNPADSRMRSTAKRRGVEITSISRPIRPSDFTEFDLILAMDKSNRADILEAYEGWKKRRNLPSDSDKKVKLMCSYCKRHDETEVPDPYYGGQQGFEKVLDILEDACESLLDSILTETSQT